MFQATRPKVRRSLADLADGGAGALAGAGGVHSQLGRKSSGGSLFGAAEIAQDFVMIDLKTPFATQG